MNIKVVFEKVKSFQVWTSLERQVNLRVEEMQQMIVPSAIITVFLPCAVRQSKW